jgi:hypothetical protein
MSDKVRDTLKALDADKHLYDYNYHATREEALEAVMRALQGDGATPAGQDDRKPDLRTATTQHRS